MRDIDELNERFSDRVHFIDGGLATELEARGHDISGKLWSGHVLLNDVAAIEQLHYDYLVAGADIIITASYQVSIPGMREAGYSRQDALSALELSVEAGTRARRRWCAAKAVTSWDEQPLIAASVGPYGAYLADGSEYTGDYELDAAGLQAFHRERLELFIQSDADLLAFETVPSLTEALVYADLVKPCGGRQRGSVSPVETASTSVTGLILPRRSGLYCEAIQIGSRLASTVLHRNTSNAPLRQWPKRPTSAWLATPTAAKPGTPITAAGPAKTTPSRLLIMRSDGLPVAPDLSADAVAPAHPISQDLRASLGKN